MDQAKSAKFGFEAEMTEYAAQLVRALEKEHLLARSDVPEPLQVAAELSSDESIGGTLINMLETTEGNTGHVYVQSLCQQAAEIGLVDKRELILVA
jgi:hypothetical protein